MWKALARTREYKRISASVIARPSFAAFVCLLRVGGVGCFFCNFKGYEEVESVWASFMYIYGEH